MSSLWAAVFGWIRNVKVKTIKTSLSSTAADSLTEAEYLPSMHSAYVSFGPQNILQAERESGWGGFKHITFLSTQREGGCLKHKVISTVICQWKTSTGQRDRRWDMRGEKQSIYSLFGSGRNQSTKLNHSHISKTKVYKLKKQKTIWNRINRKIWLNS